MRSRLGRRTASLIAGALLALFAGTGAAVAAGGAKAPTTTRAFSATGTPPITTTTTIATATRTISTTATATATTTTTATTKAPAKRKKPKQPQPAIPLSGWLADTAAFPQRTLVLTAGTQQPLSAAGLHISENGTGVGSFTLTPVANAGPGDAAVVVAIDQSTPMRGASLNTEIAGVRALSAVRPANEKLGLIGFDRKASSYMSPNASPSRIATALAGTPSTGRGANPPAAIALALRQLAASKVALGVIVVISDGKAIRLGTGDPTPQAVKAAAAAANRPVITLGLNDAGATPASLRSVAQAAPGAYETVTPAQLPAAMLSIQRQLSSNYVVRYRSGAPYGEPVVVSASAAGITGSVQATYRSPAPPPTLAPPPAPKPAPHHSGPNFADTTLLSPTPSFAKAPAPAPALVSNSFWTSSSWIPIVAALSAALLVAAIALALRRPSKKAVRTRVATFVPLAQEAADESAEGSAEGGRKTGVLSSLQRGSWWPPFVLAVEISGSPHTPVYLVKRAAAIGLVAALLVTVVTGSVLFGLLPLIGWPYLLKKGVNRGADKQRMKFAETLPSYLQDIASAIRVGRSFAGAVAVVADSADEPTRSQLERAATDEALGLPLEETLQAVSVRMQNNDMDQVALIAGVHRRTGSNIAEPLDRVAEGARERADLRREMRALTSQAKMSSSVLTGLPVVLLLGLNVLSPTYAHPLLHTTMGLIALGFGALLIFAGWKVMGKITKIKV